MRCTLHNETQFFSNCTGISVHDLKVLALVRGSVGAFCFVLCLATFLFELCYICRKKSSTTLQRLFVYLTFSNVLYTAVLSCHVEHYFEYSETVQCYLCKIIGFSDQYAGSVQLLLTLGISFKLFHKMLSFWRSKKIRKEVAQHRLKFEGLFLAACFILPLLVIWVPFLMKNEPGDYGVDGAWCWIQVLQQDNCHGSRTGFLEQLFLWYIPFAAVSTLSLLCVLAIVGPLIYICCHHKMFRDKIRAVVMDMLLLLPFLVALWCVWLVEILTIILVRVNRERDEIELNRHVLWMSYAITTPIGGVVIPIAFFVYFLRMKRYGTSQKLREFSNIGTAKPSTRVSAKSFTSQQERPNFLSPPEFTDSAVVVDPPLLGTSSNSNYGSMRGRFHDD